MYGLVRDPENDGILNSLEFLNPTQFLGTPYSSWSDWRSFWRVDG